MNLVRGHFTNIASFHLLLLGILGVLVLCLISGAAMLLKPPENRNHGRCFHTSRLWFLQWWDVLMLLFLCTEGSVKLLGMEALLSAERYDWIYFLISFIKKISFALIFLSTFSPFIFPLLFFSVTTRYCYL